MSSRTTAWLTDERTCRGQLPTTRPLRTTEPTLSQEPITLEEAKYQCGVSEAVTYHDAWFTTNIPSARQQMEDDTGLVCYTGQFTWKFTYFPPQGWLDIPNVRPVTAITSITYIDTAGATQTWSSSLYTLGTYETNPVVQLAYLQVWPVVRGDPNGVTVTLTAGYASVAVIPQQIKTAVALKLKALWQAANDSDPTQTEKAYDRVVNGLIRSTYP